MAIIGIMGAMPEEVSNITARLQNCTQEEYAGVQYYQGEYAGQHLVVCHAGIGKANAASTLQVLITRYQAAQIIFSGIAGNTSSSIGIGDVVIGESVVYHDTENRMLEQSAPFTATYTADAALVQLAQAACRKLGVHYLVGRIATGDCFVGDAQTKARIVAACQPDCVEMEGAAVAQIAMRNHVPFVVLRAMSDNSDKSAEELGGETFDIEAYVATDAAIVLAMLEEMEAAKA